MDKEIIKKLNDLRNELDISKEDFVNLLTMALQFKKNSIKHISDEQLYLLLENVLLNVDNYDLETEEEFVLKKSLKQTIKKGIECFDNKR